MKRITLVIADDVLVTAKAIAQEQGRTLGDVVSELARRTLNTPAGPRSRNGIPLLPVHEASVRVTPKIVNELCDEAP